MVLVEIKFGQIMAMGIVISLIMLFVGIAVLVFIHVCIVGRAFRRDSSNNNNGHGGGGGGQGQSSSTMKRSCGDDNGDLKNLPCFDYEEPEKGCSLMDCAVCLENFKVGDVCRLMPNCGHSFHVQCIDSWILKTPFCPICRIWVHSRVMIEKEGESAVSNNLEVDMA